MTPNDPTIPRVAEKTVGPPGATLQPPNLLLPRRLYLVETLPPLKLTGKNKSGTKLSYVGRWKPVLAKDSSLQGSVNLSKERMIKLHTIIM